MGDLTLNQPPTDEQIETSLRRIGTGKVRRSIPVGPDDDDVVLSNAIESLRSSLRAAEAERDDARALYTETEIAAANRVRDLSREVGALEDRLRGAENTAEENKVEWYAAVKCTREECDRADAAESRARAAEERAEAAERWLAGVREDFRLYAINAERRVEGLEEDRERLLALLADVWAQFSCAVPEYPGVAHDGGLSTLEDVQIALEAAGRMETAGVAGRDWWRLLTARPRSEETPTSPGRGDPWCTAGFNAACSCERCAPAATDKETP